MMDPIILQALKTIEERISTRYGSGTRRGVRASCGENTVSISPGRIEVTNKDCVVVARGPARVARFLSQKAGGYPLGDGLTSSRGRVTVTKSRSVGPTTFIKEVA